MKQTFLSFALLLILVSCAAPVKKTEETVQALQPTPTHTPTVLLGNPNQMWRNSTDLPVALSAEEVWKKLSRPEEWSSYFPAVKNAAMVGAELRQGSEITWSYQGKEVLSEVLVYKRDEKLVIKGLPYSPDAELEYSLRPAGTSTLVHIECRLNAGWKKGQDTTQAEFFQALASAVQGIK